MKSMIISLTLFLALNVFTFDVNGEILCDSVSCVGPETIFDPMKNELTIELNSPKSETIKNDTEQEPLDLNIEVKDLAEEGTSNTLNITILGETKNSNFSSPYHTLISEILGQVAIDLDGKTGSDGKSSALVCAENFKDGSFGLDAQEFFNNRRNLDSSIPSQECTAEDIEFLDNRFSCADGESFSEDPIISISRTGERRMCSGTFRRAVCLKRKVDFNCRSYLKRINCCSTNLSSFNGNQGSYFPNIPGWSCDASLCREYNGDIYAGLYKDYSIKIWEYELETGDLDSKCLDIFKENNDIDSPLTISWNDTNIDENTVLSLRNSSGSVSRDDQYFIIPQINVVGATNYVLGIENSTIPVTDCLGLNNSNHEDLFCKKTQKSDVGEVTFFALSESGVKSNSLTIKIQGNRPAYDRVWRNLVYWDAANRTSINGAHCENPDLYGGFPRRDFQLANHWPHNQTYVESSGSYYNFEYYMPAQRAYNCYPGGQDRVADCNQAYYPTTYEGYYRPYQSQYNNNSTAVCVRHDQGASYPCPTYSRLISCFESQQEFYYEAGWYAQVPKSQWCRPVQKYPVYNGTTYTNYYDGKESMFGGGNISTANTRTVWQMSSCTRNGYL